jgi:hypothetical protein
MKSAVVKRLGSLASLVAGLIAFAGCAAVPADGGTRDATATALERKTLAIEVGETPNFYADTPDRRFFGILGVFSMASAGNQLVKELGITDPAREMADALRADLGRRFQLVPSDAGDRTADLQLQIRTVTWDFRPYRNDAQRSYVVYAARLVLTDVASGRTIQSARCQSAPAGPDDLASVPDLLQDGGQRLRTELREAAGQCFASLRTGPLGVVLRGGTAVAQR